MLVGRSATETIYVFHKKGWNEGKGHVEVDKYVTKI